MLRMGLETSIEANDCAIWFRNRLANKDMNPAIADLGVKISLAPKSWFKWAWKQV